VTGLGPIGEDDIQAAVDGRVDAPRCGLVRDYLERTPDAAARVEALREQKDALRERLQAKAEEPIPARLRVAHLSGEIGRRRRGIFLRRAAVVAWLVVGGGIGWFAHEYFQGHSTDVTSEAIAAHRVFVVEVRHPVEVAAAEEAHLVQWLSRRLGRPLKAPDLAQHGYRLIGGRLLSAGQGPAAQLMYEDQNAQRITIYLRADPEGRGTEFRWAEAGGVGTFWWRDDAFGYAVSGTADRKRLLGLAETVHRQVAEASR
jgi:anti-sigma factor RsiW